MNTEKIEKQIDEWLVEVANVTTEIRNNPNADIAVLASYADRWDGIRTDAFLRRSQVWRKHSDAKAEYDDSLRDEMRKASRRQGDFSAYEERKANYEAKVIGYLQALREYERVLTQLNDLLSFLRDKERWLDAKRFNAHHNEKKELHYSARENMIVD